MIDKIAQDLGIYQYIEEPLPQFKCRVVYSAMACWIKAIALDRPVGYQDINPPGVSRRHIHDRSQMILGTMIRMFPEICEWFDLSEDNDDAVNLIRTRLINHGDLLNSGFDTNLALSAEHSVQITSSIETVYGKTIDKSIQYSGVAAIRPNEEKGYLEKTESIIEWMHSFFNNAAWSHSIPNDGLLQFYNPTSNVRNNYAAWQENIGSITGNVLLVRTVVNNSSYSYYLLKPEEKLIHRIDPFLQSQGYHIRVMCALRSQANNKTEATLTEFNDHIKIRLNAILPMQEKCMLESYAWPVRRINDKLEWAMGSSVWNHIRPHIEALDILIMEEKHG